MPAKQRLVAGNLTNPLPSNLHPCYCGDARISNSRGGRICFDSIPTAARDFIRSDNGPEFVARDEGWTYQAIADELTKLEFPTK